MKYLARVSYRELDPDDRGPCYTFDVDKTYLDTDFGSIAGLMRMPLEVALDKRPYPGVPILIRGLQRGTQATGHDRPTFFVSASPRQMLRTLEKRLVLDEIALDGVTLKDWFEVVRVSGPSGLTNQIGYKLVALLATRVALPRGVFEVLFGDDSEADPIIYHGYARIVRGELRGGALERWLTDHHVARTLVRDVLSLSERISVPCDVHDIFIHKVSTKTFSAEDLFFYQTPIEPAVVLYLEGLLLGESVGAVYRAVLAHSTVRAAQSWAAVATRLPLDTDWPALLNDPHAVWPLQGATPATPKGS